MTFYINYLNYAGFNKSAEPSVVGQGFTSSGGETTGAAYDLVDGFHDKTITIDTDGEATDFSIDFDLTNNQAMEFCIVQNVNLDSAGAHADMSLTYNGGTNISGIVWYLGDITNESTGLNYMDQANLTGTYWVDGDEVGNTDRDYLAEFSSQTDDQWELQFRDNGGANFDADVEIGEIVLGKIFTPSVNPNIGKLRSVNYGSYFQESGGGSRYGFKDFPERRRWTARFTYLTDNDRKSFETMWKVTNGKRYPFYVNLNPDTDTRFIHKVRFLNESLDFQEIPGGRWNLTINIEEDIN